MSPEKRFSALCCALTLPLFVIRVAEALWRIDPATGYYTDGYRWYHAVLPTLAIAAAVYLWISLKREKPDAQMSCGTIGTAVIAVAGLLVALSSVAQLIQNFSGHRLAHFFMSRKQLSALGIAQGGFKLSVFCSLVGLCAAAWLLLAAVRTLKADGTLGKNFALSLSLPIWCALRAVVCFASGPINANDSIKIASVASCMILANSWLSLMRFIFLERNGAVARRACALSLLGMLFAVGFAAPGIICLLKTGEGSEALLLAADAALAFAGAALAHSIFKSCKEVKHEQSQGS
ncbi:MAG: hypothetical protein RR998_07110 [Oscillospiraceae bacterium]